MALELPPLRHAMAIRVGLRIAGRAPSSRWSSLCCRRSWPPACVTAIHRASGLDGSADRRAGRGDVGGAKYRHATDLANAASTTVITLNVTQLALDSVAIFRELKDATAVEAWERMALMTPTLASWRTRRPAA